MDVFKGGDLTISDKLCLYALEIKSKIDWNLREEKLIKDSEEFIQSIENMKSEKLLDVFVNEDYGLYFRSVDVIVEYTYYHFGQIILIKRS